MAYLKDILYGVLDALTAFRAEVRNSAIKKEPYENILKSADAVRNVTLPSLGVRIGDNKDGTSVWKLDDKETLLKQIQLNKEVPAVSFSTYNLARRTQSKNETAQ